ncbi:MAG TPA: hypothetical protein VJV79_35240 [Polyangiaceae bacterium]|nr:hypothetical protein [Polyangiaceae bacterium]
MISWHAIFAAAFVYGTACTHTTVQPSVQKPLAAPRIVEAPSPPAAPERIRVVRDDVLVVNTPIRIKLYDGRPDPIIGFLRKGTFVNGYDTVAHFPEVPRLGDYSYDSLRNYILVQFDEWIVPTAIPRELAVGTEKPGDIYYGLYRELSAEPDALPFSFVACGRVRVLERRGNKLRVAAEFDAGELIGWIDAIVPGEEHDILCDMHDRRSALPYGYKRFRTDAEPGLKKLYAQNSTFYVPHILNEVRECEAWRIVRARASKEMKFVNETSAGTRTEVGLSIDGRRFRTGGQRKHTPDGRQVHSGCMQRYFVPEVREDRVILLRAAEGPDAPEPHGYRPASAFAWYLTREACERELPRLKTASGVCP